MSDETVRIRLLFADSGSFYEQDLDVPASSLEGVDRLVDAFQEDTHLLKKTYVDLDRLSAAWVLQDSA